MTKADLLAQTWDRVSRHRRHILRKDVAQIFDTAIGLLADDLIKRGRTIRRHSRRIVLVTVPMLGTFRVRVRPEREGRHPQTGAVIVIPETRTIAFTPCRDLKADLNRKRIGIAGGASRESVA